MTLRKPIGKLQFGRLPGHIDFLVPGEDLSQTDREVKTYLRLALDDFLQQFRAGPCELVRDDLFNQGWRVRFFDAEKREHVFGVSFTEMVALGDIGDDGLVKRILDLMIQRSRERLYGVHDAQATQ